MKKKFLLMVLVSVCSLNLQQAQAFEPSAKRVRTEAGSAASILASLAHAPVSGNWDNDEWLTTIPGVYKLSKPFNGYPSYGASLSAIDKLIKLGVSIQTVSERRGLLEGVEHPILFIRCPECRGWVSTVASKGGASISKRLSSALKYHKQQGRCKKVSGNVESGNSSSAAFAPAAGASKVDMKTVNSLNERVDEWLRSKNQMPDYDSLSPVQFNREKALKLQKRLDEMVDSKGRFKPGASYEDEEDAE